MGTICCGGFAELRADLLSVDLALAGTFPPLVHKTSAGDGRCGAGRNFTIDILVF